MTTPTLALPYDFAVLDGAANPRTIVYHLDRPGHEVAWFSLDIDPDGARAETLADALNRPLLEAEDILAAQKRLIERQPTPPS